MSLALSLQGMISSQIITKYVTTVLLVGSDHIISLAHGLVHIIFETAIEPDGKRADIYHT